MSAGSRPASETVTQKHVSAHLDKPGCAGLCASASLCPTVAPGSVLELLSRALTPPTTPPTCCMFPRMLSSSVYDVKTQTVESELLLLLLLHLLPVALALLTVSSLLLCLFFSCVCEGLCDSGPVKSDVWDAKGGVVPYLPTSPAPAARSSRPHLLLPPLSSCLLPPSLIRGVCCLSLSSCGFVACDLLYYLRNNNRNIKSCLSTSFVLMLSEKSLTGFH